MSPQEAIGVALILVALAVPVIIISLVIFFANRFKHKQIMAAIEKGTPLSDLRPTKKYGVSWIRNITGGIIVVSLGLAFVFAGPDYTRSPALFVAIILFGVGIAGIVRGLLYRKYSAHSGKIQSSNKNNAVEN
jgi:sterol desaturase/sphingolipid hydroxylase (fatty acid hydroxylase superfamily)